MHFSGANVGRIHHLGTIKQVIRVLAIPGQLPSGRKSSFNPSRIMNHNYDHVIWYVVLESSARLTQVARRPLPAVGKAMLKFAYQTCMRFGKNRTSITHIGNSFSRTVCNQNRGESQISHHNPILPRRRNLSITSKNQKIFEDQICLRQCHKTLHSEAFLLREPSKEEIEQREALRELSILRYYLQYGGIPTIVRPSDKP